MPMMDDHLTAKHSFAI